MLTLAVNIYNTILPDTMETYFSLLNTHEQPHIKLPCENHSLEYSIPRAAPAQAPRGVPAPAVAPEPTPVQEPTFFLNAEAEVPPTRPATP
eukprot:4717363-Pleurochrysis_carterae.AAC.1